MSSQLGTAANPLRVAIIGSGPSGFYAAEGLFKKTDIVVFIDMYDRLPTPFGLVRGGVAPDHPKIKSVTKVYDRIAHNPNFRFFGNVEFGSDVTHDDLVQHYHQIIYAVGSQTDKQMGIPGEDLAGSHAATEFVGWYNGHPDYRDLSFDLTQKRAAVIGNGNVAMDVARILARSYAELKATDIADYALEALKASKVREIYVLGRRGPAQAAFTNPEIKELGEMEEAEVHVAPKEAELDALTREWLVKNSDRTVEQNVQTLERYAHNGNGHGSKPRRIYLRFLVSPTELIGKERVEAIKIVKNELYKADDGSLRPRATREYETIPVGLVFRSIGYRGVALPGVPFYEKWATIPNTCGRVTVTQGGEQVVGDYVVGWIKRGPSGVIGTNKPDAYETVDMMLEDVAAGKTLQPVSPSREAVVNLLKERKPNYVTFHDWELLDQLELQRGADAGRPRLKFSRVEDMLAALEQQKQPNPAGD